MIGNSLQLHRTAMGILLCLFKLQGDDKSTSTVKITAGSDEYIDNAGECHTCHVFCDRCYGPSDVECITCSTPRFYDSGYCATNCPTGKFDMNGQCYSCHHTCKECTGSEPNNCTSCDQDKFRNDRYLFNSVCREDCPTSHYPAAGNICLPCSSNCEVCTSDTHCVKCSSGYYPNPEGCQQLKCEEGEIADPDYEDCIQCGEGCEKCILDDPRKCTLCKDGYYIFHHHCYETCPAKTYKNISKMECDVCHENCIDCDEEQCYWCETGFFLSEIECVYTCQGGYYGNEDSAVCDVCHPTCDTCHGPSFEDCDSCKNDQIFQDGMCILNSSVPCKEGNYWNVEEKSCFPCSDLCKTCTGEGWNECTSCHSGFYLYREICVSDCPKHTFADSISEMCEQCEEGCETCSGNKNDCQQCITVQHRPLYLHLGKCLSECPLGYFISTRNTCAKCDDTCESCEATPENCQSCVKPYLLDNNSCQKQCSRKQYASAQGFCKRCPANCEACNEHNCTECSRHFFFHKGACLQDCPPGFFQSTQTFTCTSCHPECSVCDGPDSDDCEGCANPSLLMHDGQCLKSCPEGTYVDKGTQDCQECHQTCRTCEGPYSTDCIHCREGMMQNSQGHCVMHKDCALNMYMDQICRPCHKKCHRCYGPSEQDCLSCTHNYFLLNRTCVDACPGGYYTEESRRHCFACHKSCETCNGRSNTQCLTCKADWYRLKLTCVKTCGSGHFANGSTGVCEKCHTSCKECRGPGDAECLSCQDDNFLMKSHNRCYSSCPERYYEDEWEQTCARCHPSCKICDGKGPIRCTSCFWGFRMVGSICSSQCFAGEYLLSEDPEIMCGKCHDTCLECKGPGLYNCTNCHPGLLLNVEDGNCLNCCRSALSDFEDCCDCDMRFDECVLRKAVVVPDVEGSGKPALFAIASVLLIMGIGIGVFLLLKSRSKAKPTNRAGYEKLPNQAKSIPVYNASRDSVSFQEHQATDYKDRQEKIYDEEDDDDDIVYMGQDGTVYRKFKYGLLDDDEDDELEYDDESYSFR